MSPPLLATARHCSLSQISGGGGDAVAVDCYYSFFSHHSLILSLFLQGFLPVNPDAPTTIFGAVMALPRLPFVRDAVSVAEGKLPFFRCRLLTPQASVSAPGR